MGRQSSCFCQLCRMVVLLRPCAHCLATPVTLPRHPWGSLLAPLPYPPASPLPSPPLVCRAPPALPLPFFLSSFPSLLDHPLAPSQSAPPGLPAFSLARPSSSDGRAGRGAGPGQRDGGRDEGEGIARGDAGGRGATGRGGERGRMNRGLVECISMGLCLAGAPPSLAPFTSERCFQTAAGELAPRFPTSPHQTNMVFR